MKFLLPALLIGASTAYAGVESTFTSANYLLLYPKAALETDAGGHCARLTNLSEGLVYVPLIEPIDAAAKTYPGILRVEDCARR